MLRACRRALRPGGRIAFYTIFIPAGLSEDAYQRAVLAGPRSVASSGDHEQMLRSARLTEIDEVDVTDEFLRVAQGWLEGRERHADQLRRSEGKSEFDTSQAERRAGVAAIEAGLLRRSLFVAGRPP